MSRAKGRTELEPFDPEIENTFRRRRRAQREKSSDFDVEEQLKQEEKVEIVGIEEMENEEVDRTVYDLTRQTTGGYGSSITRPTVEANNFELKPSIIQMIQYQVRFGGSQTEDPNAHLDGFLSICDTIKFNGVSTNAIRLRLFPFSLHGEAEEWHRDLPAGLITTWNGLVEMFMNQYFPPTKLAQLRMDISSFRRKDGETLHTAWGRFRKMFRRCPQHGFSSSEQVQIFYNGVDPSVHLMLDAAANGSLYRKTPRVALEIISNMAENSAGWPDIKLEKKAGVLEMDVLNALTAKIDGLAHQFSQLQSNQANQVQGIVIEEQSIFDEEAVNFVGNQWRQQSNPYSSTYNPGWKHHPNFSWKNTENSLNPTHIPPLPIPQQVRQQGLLVPAAPPGFKQEDQRQIYKDFMMKHVVEMETRLQNHDAILRRFDAQMGQIANQLANRLLGTLPSDTEKNPKGVNTVIKAEEEEPKMQNSTDMEAKNDGGVESKTEDAKEPNTHTTPTRKTGKKGKEFDSNDNIDINTLSFPQRAMQLQLDQQFSKFLERKLVDFETVKLSEECSAILQNKLPPKLKDPGSFSIPCTIVKPTTISLQLADRSIKYPRGVIEDVLVKVDKFIFPVDFVVLDMEEDREIPLILGHPFLAIGRADVQKGELVLRLNDEKVTFNVFRSMKYPGSSDCYRIDAIEDIVECSVQDTFSEDPLEMLLVNPKSTESDREEVEECMNYLEGSKPLPRSEEEFFEEFLCEDEAEEKLEDVEEHKSKDLNSYMVNPL
ncbi:uncharacterized protein LOC142525987 [Primulina tabacum]|uniref:uncharacterized protein LOC142525987 n=1 Tax=Primulina tabacum TaxID=48773 RepID=UPI003F5A39BA